MSRKNQKVIDFTNGGANELIDIVKQKSIIEL